LEGLLARIDAPVLSGLHIVFFQSAHFHCPMPLGFHAHVREPQL
jgi:hypothetical protein